MTPRPSRSPLYLVADLAEEVAEGLRQVAELGPEELRQMAGRHRGSVRRLLIRRAVRVEGSAKLNQLLGPPAGG